MTQAPWPAAPNPGQEQVCPSGAGAASCGATLLGESAWAAAARRLARGGFTELH